MPVEKLSKDEQKELVKEALTEWLDKQFATFGKWTLAGVASVALSALLYAFVHTKGFAK